MLKAFAAFIVGIVILGGNASAQTTVATAKPITVDSTNAEIAERLEAPTKSMERFIYSFVRVGWEQKCIDKLTRKWRDTNECTTGDGDKTFKIQVAYVLCKIKAKEFKDNIFQHPLRGMDAVGIALVQDGVDYCERHARDALALVQ